MPSAAVILEAETALTVPGVCRREVTVALVSASPPAEHQSRAYFLNTASRFAGFALRSRAHRSPTSAKRAGAVVIVKSRGSIASSISFQSSGVETPAKLLARAL